MKLIFSRKSEWINRLRPFKVMINGEEAGLISNGQVEEFELPTGTHTVKCKFMWYYSNEYVFNDLEGNPVYLQVKNGMKGFWVVYALLFVFLIFNFISRDVNNSFGGYGVWMRVGLSVFVVGYFLYYLTIGRRQYLKIEKDTSNIFAT